MSDNNLYSSQNGVSFYNNLFAQLVTDHIILSNKCYLNTGAGINIGSISDSTVGFYPSINSYIVGNDVYDNGVTATSNFERFGFNSNGPVYGFYVSANSDTQGMSRIFTIGYTTKGYYTLGGLVVSDPMQRMMYPTGAGTAAPVVLTASPTKGPSRSPTLFPTTAGTLSALNVTITNGVITSYFGTPSTSITVGAAVGLTCSALNSFITTYFTSLWLADASQIPWMWQKSYSNASVVVELKQAISFLTLIGNYSCDTPLLLPDQLMLVLQGASITAASSLSTAALGIIVASSAHFSGVVSPGGYSQATISCGQVSGPSGIYVYSSSYFTIDGVYVTGCGSNGATPGGIVLIGTSSTTVGNSTSVLNSKVESSTGNGIYGESIRRLVVYNTYITSSELHGIYVNNSYGPGDVLIAY